MDPDPAKWCGNASLKPYFTVLLFVNDTGSIMFSIINTEITWKFVNSLKICLGVTRTVWDAIFRYNETGLSQSLTHQKLACDRNRTCAVVSGSEHTLINRRQWYIFFYPPKKGSKQGFDKKNYNSNPYPVNKWQHWYLNQIYKLLSSMRTCPSTPGC